MSAKTLGSLTVVQLRQLAGHLGIGLSGANRKGEIVGRIRVVDEATLSSRSDAELKEVLGLLGEPKSGTKAELVSRLMGALGASAPTPTSPAPAPAPAPQRRPTRRAIVTTIVVLLVLWGLVALGHYHVGRACQAQLARIPVSVVAEAEVPEAVEAEVSAPIVVHQETPEPAATAVPALVIEVTASEEEVLIEIAGDGALMEHLSDPNRFPEFTLEPGRGVVISMDPGAVLSGTQEIVSSEEGMLISIFNASGKPLEVSIETGWNVPNGRWNTHAVSFAGTPEQVFARALEWQGTLESGAGEHKPIFRLFAVAAAGIADVTP